MFTGVGGGSPPACVGEDRDAGDEWRWWGALIVRGTSLGAVL